MFLEEVIETLALGGPLMIPIAGVCGLAWALLAERWLWLHGQEDAARFAAEVAGMLEKGGSEAALEACRTRRGMAAKAAARLLEALRGVSPSAAASLAHEAKLREFPGASRGFPGIAVLASVAPLLGLLGTVTGMIATFHGITEFGMGNPRSMAEGVSEALITTEAGLIVALPTLVAHDWLKHRADRLLRSAEEFLDRLGQIAGIPEAERRTGTAGKGSLP
jgi:biopolymer transport protein ExbB